MRAKQTVLPAIMLGLAGGYAWSVMPSAAAEPMGATATAKPTAEEIEHSAYYPDCRAAWAAGHAPIFAGQPGYRERLDGDRDGIACELFRSR